MVGHSSIGAAILTICPSGTLVSAGWWLACGEGTMTYPGTALSLENGHLRVSESARDGGGKEDALNEGNDSLKKKK